MGVLLRPAEYPAIRAVLQVGLTSSRLPDDVLSLDFYTGAAEREVLALAPEVTALPASSLDFLHARNAAILLAASRIAPRLPSIRSESAGPLSVSVDPEDWDAKAAELRGQALAELGAILGVVVTLPVSRPTFFTVAPGTRGR